MIKINRGFVRIDPAKRQALEIIIGEVFPATMSAEVEQVSPEGNHLT
ncbi:MAG: hypothetical protein IPK84_04100 [Candidatus Moraniibacteriota bacterium]|nr:MAG: hypothetical protein IPK84_04100 [Candidatus Moranbacteria bacterium]